eukprot:TRINITY_DN66700_c4_g1_i1.p1 TRINITY_DN66700_c4_g1~~TRINITY_DN66700_c4_g1_i1.p1  ORF type:complete len:583 (+),score=32.68 TRINITY_DN66700_c4_g1_i1:128-1876(+)
MTKFLSVSDALVCEWKIESSNSSTYVVFESEGQAFGVPRNFCGSIGIFTAATEMDSGCDKLPLLQGSPARIQRLLEAEVLRQRCPFGSLATIKPMLHPHWSQALPTWWESWLNVAQAGELSPQMELANLIAVGDYLNMPVMVNVLCSALSRMEWDPEVWSVIGTADLLGLVLASRPSLVDVVTKGHEESFDDIARSSAQACDIGQPWITLPLKAGQQVDLTKADPSSKKDSDRFAILKESVDHVTTVLLHDDTSRTVTPTELWWLYNLTQQLMTDTGESEIPAAEQVLQLAKDTFQHCAHTTLGKTGDVSTEEGKDRLLSLYKRAVYPLSQVFGYLEDYYLKSKNLLQLAEACLLEEMSHPALVEGKGYFQPKEDKTDKNANADKPSPEQKPKESEKASQLLDILLVQLDNNFDTVPLSAAVWKQIPLFEECFMGRFIQQAQQGGIQGDNLVIGMSGMNNAAFTEIVKFLDHHAVHPFPVFPKPLTGSISEVLVDYPWDLAWLHDRLIEDGDESKHSLLIEVISLANKMRLHTVVDIASAAMASLIRGKSPAEIRALFHIENDFTPEEEEKIREENRWCEEM